MQQTILTGRNPAHAPSRLIAATARSPALPVKSPVAGLASPGVAEWDRVMVPPDLMAERRAKEDLKWYLMNKYRALLTDRLTQGDLEELQYCLRNQYDKKRGWNREYQDRFLRKMRGYIGEEILKREIAGIESLLTLIRQEDLRTLRGEISSRHERNEDPGSATPLKSLR